MTGHRSKLALPVVLAALASCGHTEPPSFTQPQESGPFDRTVPIRLTYSSRSDRNPSWSRDGSAITYSYESGRADGDVFIGVLPAGGGQQSRSRCGWGEDDANWVDGSGTSALASDGRLLFVRHRSVRSDPGDRSADLFVSAPGSVPVRLLQLGRIPPNAVARWDDILDMTWLDDETMLVVGAHRTRIPSCTDICPRDAVRYNGPDTARIGQEIARLSGLGGNQPVLSSVVARNGILAIALDRDRNELLVLQQFHDPADDVFFEPLADTIYRMPVGGGPLTPVVGTANSGSPELMRYHSVAVAGGRIFISRSWYDGSPPAPRADMMGSDIAELLPDGRMQSAQVMGPGRRWGRITASPDGRSLVAELATGSSHDLYLIPLQ